jgi:gamma-glutamyltranspeptidase/glutathione hydrolase
MAMGRKGMVASSHYLGTQAGLEILKSGGSAMDAAVAVAAVLGVVEPAMIGIGGDAFFLYYEAASKKVYGYNGSGRSPRGLSREHFGDRKNIERESWESVTVPGAVDAYAAGLARFGRMGLKEALAPAIGYAMDGYPVHEQVGMTWAAQEAVLKRSGWASKLKLADGSAPRVGSVFVDEAYGRTLEMIAEGGRDAFYAGAIAEEIVRYSDESGGFLSREDFSDHEGNWVEPMSTNYRGYDVYQCPPNGQGGAVISMLNMLEGFDVGAMEFQSAEQLHLMIEVKKLAYADIERYFGDPERGDIPLEVLLSKAYAAERRGLIDMGTAAKQVDAGIPKHGDTAYMSVVDSEGNACSFINSLYFPFGSGIVGGNTGVFLQSRGMGFSLEPGNFNEYAPGVRPFHTIIPGMVLRGDDLYMSYGVMGGPMQPHGHVQFLTNHLDHGFSIQEAIDIPRFRHDSGLSVALETGMSAEVWEGLAGLGHELKTGEFSTMGGAQAVMVDGVTGVLYGASDPRKDGVALGY